MLPYGAWMGDHQWDTNGTSNRLIWYVFDGWNDFELWVPPYRVIIENVMKTFFYAMNPTKSISIT